jgi:NhaP-type Na+/H+ or K+/H+ antiporter
LECLIIAACTAPTDPILANSIVNGRFADMHIPVPIRQLLSAESSANDGLALPMFTIGVYMSTMSMDKAFIKWAWATWAYEIGIAIAFGTLVGYLSRICLRYSETHNLIDKKNFLSFEIALAVRFILCLCGVVCSSYPGLIRNAKTGFRHGLCYHIPFFLIHRCFYYGSRLCLGRLVCK